MTSMCVVGSTLTVQLCTTWFPGCPGVYLCVCYDHHVCGGVYLYSCVLPGSLAVLVCTRVSVMTSMCAVGCTLTVQLCTTWLPGCPAVYLCVCYDQHVYGGEYLNCTAVY